LVRDVLCDYFTQLLDIISSHAGDVIKVVGDALMAIFPVDPFRKLVSGKNRQQIALLAAIQCALKACRVTHR
jgi:class 3 adenylate cyclase